MPLPVITTLSHTVKLSTPGNMQQLIPNHSGEMGRDPSAWKFAKHLQASADTYVSKEVEHLFILQSLHLWSAAREPTLNKSVQYA